MTGPELELMVNVFKALADESRLRMLGLVAERERSVEELASLLALKGSTVSHHLARLKGLGLVTMRAEGNTHLYRLDSDALRHLNRDLLSPDKLVRAASDVAGEAWESKVLKDFFEGDPTPECPFGLRLKEIPASRKKREVVLRWLAGRFEPGRRYPEKEVNALIGRHHPDFATLRRELVGADLVRRETGVYWRVD